MDGQVLSNPAIMTLTVLETGTCFSVTGATHIGRSERMREWAVAERESPEIFESLEVLLVLADNKPRKGISRNHAAIYRVGEEYFLIDLNSLNGTYLNGLNINPERKSPRPHLLSIGDEITIAKTVTLKVGPVTNKTTHCHAVLIGAGEDNPGAASSDIIRLHKVLNQSGFAENITIIHPADATKRNVFGALRRLARDAVPHSRCLIYFHAHAGQHGIYLGQENRQIVNPRQLYEKLSNIRGKKALVLDCCNAGLFLNATHLIPSDTLVIAASGERCEAREKFNPSLEIYSGRLTEALLQYFKGHVGPLDLAEFKNYFEYPVTGHTQLFMQNPRCYGNTFTIIFGLDHM